MPSRWLRYLGQAATFEGERWRLPLHVLSSRRIHATTPGGVG